MEERIQSMHASWPFPDIKINLEEIEANQQEASGWLEQSLHGAHKRAKSQAEWDVIINAIERINEYMAQDTLGKTTAFDNHI